MAEPDFTKCMLALLVTVLSLLNCYTGTIEERTILTF